MFNIQTDFILLVEHPNDRKPEISDFLKKEPLFINAPEHWKDTAFLQILDVDDLPVLCFYKNKEIFAKLEQDEITIEKVKETYKKWKEK